MTPNSSPLAFDPLEVVDTDWEDPEAVAYAVLAECRRRVERGVEDGPVAVRESICADVCERHGLTMGDLSGPSRAIPQSRARKELCRRLRGAGFGVAEVAELLRRDDSTVSYLTLEGASGE